MKRSFSGIVGLLGLFLAVTGQSDALADANATCAGKNMLPSLKAGDPTGYAKARARADAIPNGKGVFWRVERPGVRPSFLYGTLHDGRAVPTVPDAAWDALDAASAAAFETSTAEGAEFDKRLAENFFGFVSDETLPSLYDALTEEERSALKTALEARGVPWTYADKMKAFGLMAILSSTVCETRNPGVRGATLDDVMEQRAQANGAPIHGLEKTEDVLAMIEGMDRLRLARGLIAPPAMQAVEDDVQTTMAILYRNRDIAMGLEFAIWVGETYAPDDDVRAEVAYIMATIGAARNHAWMPKILTLVQNGNAFVAVGALHLPGKDGLVALLRQAGWTVTRLH